MYITQCIIAKNEEENIEHCLSHLKPVVDEQIVIDTGSTDRTVELAEIMGAKVFHFDWIDDFSAARNFALDKSKGDWIIFLDCDEYFSEDSVPLIKKSINKYGNKKGIDALTCEFIDIDVTNNRILSSVKNISPRIFRRKNYLRYRKRIHEILQNVKSNPINPYSADLSDTLKIFHTGYSEVIKKEKNKDERNLNMLLKEIEENPNDIRWILYYGKQLNSSGRKEESLEYAFKAYELMDANIFYDYYYSIYSLILINMVSLRKPYDEVKEIFDEAISKYPQYPDYYMSMGTVAIREEKVNEGIDLFEKCIFCCERYTDNVESYALGSIAKVYTYLLDAYVIVDDKQKIVKTAIALLNTYKYDLTTLTILLRTFLTQEKEEDIITFLKKIYDYNNSKDKVFIFKACKIVNNNKFTDYYTTLLNEEELEAIKRSKEI